MLNGIVTVTIVYWGFGLILMSKLDAIQYMQVHAHDMSREVLKPDHHKLYL